LTIFALFLIFDCKTPRHNSNKLQLQKIVIMLRDVPSMPSPFAPSAADVLTGSLDDAFDAMLLNPHDVSPDNFSDEWFAADTEEASALSSVDDARLKECIVAALAFVWGIPMICPTQLEARYCLLHPHRPNTLVVVDQTAGGKTHILRTLGVIERGLVLIFIRCSRYLPT
jgi:hypothetical protein